MTLQEFIDKNDFPDVKKLGKINSTTYYIEKNIPDDQDLGVPFVIQEKSNDFSVCTSDESLYAIGVFGDDEE